MAKYDQVFKIKKEAIWVISGFTNSQTVEIIKYIIDNNLLKFYARILTTKNEEDEIVKVILEGLFMLMRFFVAQNSQEAFVLRLHQEGIVDALE